MLALLLVVKTAVVPQSIARPAPLPQELQGGFLNILPVWLLRALWEEPSRPRRALPQRVASSYNTAVLRVPLVVTWLVSTLLL